MSNQTIHLDDNNSRLLGIGECVEHGDYQGISPTCTGDFPIGFALCMSSIGHIVSNDYGVIYRRPLPVKQTYASGAARSASEGRGRFDLIPYEAMLCLAKRYEMGAKTFGDRNWENGVPLSRILSSMRRHAAQINYDFSEDHLGAVLWNAAAFVTMAERVRAGILPKELDDINYLGGQP